MVARDERESAAEQAMAESPESANESGAWTMVCFWRCPSRTCQNFERSRVVEPRSFEGPAFDGSRPTFN